MFSFNSYLNPKSEEEKDLRAAKNRKEIYTWHKQFDVPQLLEEQYYWQN